MGQLISQDIPNLVGGVSQQSPSLRLPTQAQEQINCWNSVVEGLKPRPATKRIGTIDVTEDDVMVLDYRRDENEHYRIVITDDGDKNLRVFDSRTGHEYPVEFKDGVLQTQDYRVGSETQTFKDVPYLRPQGRSYRDSFQLLPLFDSVLVINKSFPTRRIFGQDTLPQQGEPVRYRITFSAFSWSDYVSKSKYLYTNRDIDDPNFCGYGFKINGHTFVYDPITIYQDFAASMAKKIGNINPKFKVTVSGMTVTVTVPAGETFTFEEKTQIVWNGKKGVERRRLNTATVTAEGVHTTPKPTDRPKYEALVWVKRADYATNYIVTLNDKTAQHKTPEATSEQARDGLRTEAITQALAQSIAGLQEVTVHVSGNVIHLFSETDFTLTATDSLGDTALVAFKRVVKDESDLPGSNVPNGYKVKVRGALDDPNSSGYWLKFDRDDGGSGVWVETVALGSDNEFDKLSMPHLLTRKQDFERISEDNPYGIYFELGVAPWEPRKVGDEDTAPFPNFMSEQDPSTGEILTSRTITAACIFQNRLMLASGDTFIVSEVDHYFNLFPTTVATLVDSDPIETTIDTNDALNIEYLTPGVSHVLLWSQRRQYALTNDEVFTGGTIRSRMIAAEEVDLSVPPLPVGNRVFFVTQRGKYQAVRELYMEEGTENFAVLDVSAHIPEYIEGKVRKMVGNTANNSVFCVTTNPEVGYSSDIVYVYNYFDDGRERIQSAWSKWKFDGEVLDLAVDNTTLSFIMKRETSNGYRSYLEHIELAYDELEQYHGYSVYLDSYEYKTTPWSQSELLPGEVTKRVGDRYYKGYLLDVVYEFSPFFLRDQQNKARADGRLQLRRLFLNYHNTTNFVIEVETLGRETRELVFQGRVLGRLDNLIGVVPVTSGRFSAPIMGQSGAIKVRIKNREIFGFTFQSAFWEGFYHTRNRRV